MHWLHTLWFGYTWPSLKGNGPEAIFQTVLYGLLAWLFVPPVRAWMNRHMKDLHAKLDEAHAKIDHVIKFHPDIPPFGSDAAHAKAKRLHKPVQK